MHRDLEAWLDLAWNKREEIFTGYAKNGRAILAEDVGKHRGVGRVYAMYNAPDAGLGVVPARGDVAEALEEIVRLVTNKQANCKIQSTQFVTCSVEELKLLAGGEEVTWELKDDEGEMELIRVSQATMKWDFIHIRHATQWESRGIDQRIYLNLALIGRGRNFRRIVEMVYDLPGFRSAKVVLSDEDPRTDTALIYLAGEAAALAAIESLREFQRRHAAAFRPALPRLTAPEAGLIGVGRAMEPPDFALIKRGDTFYKRTSAMSFGWWRAALIFMALDRTKWERAGQGDAQRLRGFKRRAVKYFVAAGIDPDRPSVQVNPANLREYPV